MRQTISEILWKAANEKLSAKGGLENGRFQAACIAALAAELGSDHFVVSVAAQQSPTLRFLRLLGCNPSRDGFDSFEYGPPRQAARYSWLMFASMIAKEWGL